MTVHYIHHVTAVMRNPERSHVFYTETLGLRFVKKTVNFDDPSAYHLYYADEEGSPGTTLTFFDWRKLPDGIKGVRSISRLLFSVPLQSLPFWRERLAEHSVPYEEETLFGTEVLSFQDPDGLSITLTETERTHAQPRSSSPVPSEFQIGHIHGVELCLRTVFNDTERLLAALGYTDQVEEKGLTRRALEGRPEYALYIRLAPSLSPAQLGCGSIHHVAFIVEDEEEQAALRKKFIEYSFQPTPVIDRFYYKSVYIPLPEGVLFEIATRGPGFQRDESTEDLGTSLKLPPEYEAYRAKIEEGLSPFTG